jgi:hypothetical protein
MFILKHRGKIYKAKNIISKEFLDAALLEGTYPKANEPGNMKMLPYAGGAPSFYDLFTSHPAWSLHPDFDVGGAFVRFFFGSSLTSIQTTTTNWTATADATIDGVYIYLPDMLTWETGFLVGKFNTLYAAALLDTPLDVSLGETVFASFQIDGSINL